MKKIRDSSILDVIISVSYKIDTRVNQFHTQTMKKMLQFSEEIGMEVDRCLILACPVSLTNKIRWNCKRFCKLCGSPSEEYWRKSELPRATSLKPQQPYRRRIAERFKDFPAPALALVETLLSMDPAARLSAAHALNSEFFSSKPLACVPAAVSKPGSYNETHDSTRKQGANRNMQSIRRYANEDKKNSSRDQLLFGHYSKGENINHSGPVLAPPSILNQMRRDHISCHVEGTSGRAHVDKGKQKGVQGEAIPLPTNALYVGPDNSWP